jgi:hypothetical protein
VAGRLWSGIVFGFHDLVFWFFMDLDFQGFRIWFLLVFLRIWFTCFSGLDLVGFFWFGLLICFRIDHDVKMLISSPVLNAFRSFAY